MSTCFLKTISVYRKGQKLGEFDARACLMAATYVETLDLSGPRIMMDVDDPAGRIRDVLNVRPHDVLEVVFDDTFLRDSGDFTERFRIETLPVQGNLVTFNGFSEAVAAQKDPAPTAMLFNRTSPTTVMSRLFKAFPALQYTVDSFPAVTQHIPAGTRPAKALRQMAHEQGACLYVQRGEVVLRKLATLKKQTAAFTYYFRTPEEDKKIIAYERPNSDALINAHTRRHYLGWNMVDGVVQSRVDRGLTPEFTEYDNSATLDHLADIPHPAIDFTVLGSANLRPGVVIGLVWKTQDRERPIDESLPDKCLISTVGHHWSNCRYVCRVKGVAV